MKLKLLFISPGPVMTINRPFYRGLSDEFTGTIITSSSRDSILNTRQVESFEFLCTRFILKKKVFSNIRFIFHTVLFCMRSRISRKKYSLVITYDPLKTGLIGSVSAKILGAKFAPEVNGVYTSSAEYIDDTNSLFSSIKRRLYVLIEKIVLNQSDGIKILFPEQLAPFRTIIMNKKIACFPAFVNIEKFLDYSDREEKLILFVGFPFWRKGVDVLINAFKKVADDYPDWRLRILGWFPNTDILMDYINGHQQIEYHPPVEYAEMPSHIGRCAIFVLPSRSEAMGRVLVEAMAAGKPRIGAKVDGIPTVINDDIDGLLFEPENVKDLADKLSLLMGNRELRKKMGAAGRERAIREFNKSVYFTNLTKFYNEVVGICPGIADSGENCHLFRK